jgi:photosystem II stability/assembly factor-like uncharacterized protein
LILKTTDGGTTWLRKSFRIRSTLYAVTFADANHGWASGTYGRIYATTDGGENWYVQASATIVTSHILSLSFVSPDIGWAVGNNGTIIRTTDGGFSWYPQTSGVRWQLYSVKFLDPLNGWIAGNYGTLLATNDGGVTWQRQASSTIYSLKDIYFNDLNHGWAAGWYGAILKYSDDMVIINPSPSQQPVISAVTNYPNPFNPSTVIQFTLQEPSTVTMKLYNVLGEEVETILDMKKFNRGIQSVPYVPKEIATGVYFIRIFTQDTKFSTVRKIMFVK